jgi:hypothetical protein
MPPTEFSPQELQDQLRRRHINLGNILIENNAIIAGGSVLSSITRTYGLRDLDVYVNLRNAQNVYNALMKDGQNNYLKYSHTAPPYDQSFLIKNNILGRFTAIVGSGYLRHLTDIDIMIVADDVSVESVVENFDLSFCKIWYDGRKILTNYPDDVRNQTGTLGDDYLRAYLSGNAFTAKRIKKYTRRGFTINLPNIDTSSIIMDRLKKQVISPEIWVVYKLLEELLIGNRFGTLNNQDMELFSNMILALQKLAEYKTAHGKPSLYNIDGFKDLLNFLYGDKLTAAAEADPTADGGFWDVNKLIYQLICSNKRGLCEWISPEYAEYYKSIGIQIRREDDVAAHGFDNYDIPMCDGQIPPFSAGASGIPDDANAEYVQDLIRQGEDILRLTEEEKQTLYYTQYPSLRPLTHLERVERMREEQRLAAQRFAHLADDDDDEEEEEATGPYSLPNGTQVPGRCFSIMDAEDINTSSWYPEEDNILFLIEFYPGAEPDLVCTNVQILENALRNETAINYRCGGNIGFVAGTGREIRLDNVPDGVAVDVSMTSIDFSVEYIPFSYGIDGTTVMNGYLPRTEVERMLSQVGDGTSKLFTLVFRDTISHTVSKNNTSRGTEGADFVSTNHCQAGSAIMVFQVKEFIPPPEFGTPAPTARDPTATPGGMGPTPAQTPPTGAQRLRRAVRRLWGGEDTPPGSLFREDPLETLTPETPGEVEEREEVVQEVVQEGGETTVRVLFEGDEVVETPTA